jgi:TatD DNase family protein
LIDTHAHIYLPDFAETIDQVLQRAHEVGITDIIMPSIRFDSHGLMQQMPDSPVKLHQTAGIHPCDVTDTINKNALESWCASEEVVAIGESGLDYYWSKDHISLQKASLRLHCSLSKSLRKPIILHNRESTADMLDIIESEQDGSLNGVWHCFNGTVEEGKRAIDLGLYLGIGGVVTFKNGGVDKTVMELPLERMILETDSPYLAPVPHRGKQNEPSYIQLVAIKLSELFDLSLKEIDEITTANARQLFPRI